MDNIHKIVSEHEINHNYLGYTDKYLIRHINEARKDDDSCPDIIYKFIECIKNYRALNLNDECICTDIDINNIANTIKNSDLYQKMEKDDCETSGHLYQFQKLQITKHKPYNVFSEEIKNAKLTKKIEEDMVELLYMDRLQEGIAVIEDGKDPYLLVDSERSMLRSIYGLTYCALRVYDTNKE